MNCRARSIGITALIIGGIAAFLFLVPLPYHFRSEGVVRSEVFQNVYATSSGRVAEVLVPSGTMVAKGTPVVRLENPELLEEQRLLALEHERTEVRMRKERGTQAVGLEGITAYLRALEARQANMREQIESLVVKATGDGRWIAPALREQEGVVVPRGASLGFVRGEEGFLFSAVIRQRDVDRVFAREAPAAEVKLLGQAGTTLDLLELDAIPADQSELPSASLGVLGGGSMGVNTQEQTGSQTTEPFFELRGRLILEEGFVAEHGQRGVARFALPKTPLGFQWARRVRQIFQKEYQL